MGVEVRLFLVFLVCLPFINAQERCAYMTNIPREERPDDLPEEDFDGLTWSQRPLLPVEERRDLCIEGYFPGTITGSTIFYMEEEIEEEIAIAKLNYYGETEPVIVQPYLAGQILLLGAEIRLINGEWFLIIRNRQDYETPIMRVYMFDLQVAGESMLARVSLQIVNIDDNAPIMNIFEACQVPELGEPRLTECTYEVTDADGEISTSAMTFTVDSDRNDTEIFYVQGTNIPNEWYRMNMTIGIYSPLNFATNALHVFSVTAWDSTPNTHEVRVMVQVENVEHRDPRWVEIFAVQQFDEKTAQNFTVQAIDGDTGINKPIYYQIETAEEDTFFNITTIDGGRSGAIFMVEPIDRDALERELFQVTIIAHKYDNESLADRANIAIIVNDVNDQIPEPLQEEYWVRVREETAETLNFGDNVHFGFHDRDLGAHAQYRVHLEAEYPPGAHEAFYIAPDVGYQRQTFIMGTANHSMLDYEVPEFQHIKLRVVATDLNNTDFIGVAILYVDLINWNDEEPIFEVTDVDVSFNETEGAGFFVANVRAKDRDIGDRVEHSLMGNAGTYLTIDEDTGDIYVSANDSFDYHRQNQLFVQVRAVDTFMPPYHTTTTQIVINLLDINNTPPSLRLPRGSPHVEENVPEGYVITSEITATDPDTTADLYFEIHWESSYATKQGRETDTIEYHNCVRIETIFPDPEDRGTAIGRVVVQEIRHNVTIDFEMFEVLYLTVRVVDSNTYIGDTYDELTFTIIIIDMNDNWPIWSEGTLDAGFRVREMSDTGFAIGAVLATDIDGPLYNQVRYTIRHREDTPEGLVKIDFYTGQLEVDTPFAIDADVPPRQNLYYTVIASDECDAENRTECPPDAMFWETEGNITISIIDTNNKVPQIEYDLFDDVVYIYENATTGDEVVQLFTSDLDRDDIYHTVSYQIRYQINPRLRDFFSIDLDTGMVYVNYTTDETLDRDGDEPTHRMYFLVIDNFYSGGDGIRNQNETEVFLVLLDVNDNAPELPPPHELSWSISEGLEEGIHVLPEIYAPDRDEPDTDNSRVGYAILDLQIRNRDIEVPELFTMIQIANVTGELETAMRLQGYWGTYDIHIQAYDHGIPQQISDEWYEMVIRPFNFHAPVFVFPSWTGVTTIRLARERAVLNGMLSMVNNEFLNNIVATDEDGLHAGEVTFRVSGDADAEQHFTVMNLGSNTGTLLLTQLFTEDVREFRVTIQATDSGTEPGPLSTEATLHLVYVPTQGDPIFSQTETAVAFFEGGGGLEERFDLPLAEDPKNYLCSDDCHSIYYRICDGNDGGYFALDATENAISLVRELNRTDAQAHRLSVCAGNAPDSVTISPASTLIVEVTVREADPRPIFVRQLYTAGISTSDSINRELLTVQATHSENAAVTYTLDQESMRVDSTLEAVRDSAFVLNPQSGVLTLNMQPTAAMHGMFEFDVIATDPTNATDTAQVIVYLISTLNRVIFTFVNTVEQVEEHRDFIALTFSIGFNMTCNIDQIVPGSDSNGVALADRSELRAHFIRDDVPVPAEEIELLRRDTQLLTNIQMSLNVEQLWLLDFLTEFSPESSSDINQITVYVLAALSALLGFMCLVLLIAFIFRTRALNRRLEALSVKRFGSIDSGVMRTALAAPGTNKHAEAGSNPILNEAIRMPDIDALSDMSTDSDLIGIEDLPQFRNDYFPPSDSESMDGIIRNNDRDPIPTHANNFGFKSPPFNTNFNDKFWR